jgi:hypothetical protein
MEDLSSPISAFLRDWCIRGDQKCRVKADDLFKAWRLWCDEHGHRPGTAQNFGKILHAALPGLKLVRPWLDKAAGVRDKRHYAGVRLKQQITRRMALAT